MFRNFDNWDVYYDLNRNILQGCVQFLLKDGTTPANIYDSDKTPLDNPQITDINGRTQHQVFVDADVLAYFYKYVGEGTLAEEEALGIDTSDVSKWALQYTVESASIDEHRIEGTDAMGVGTMALLRALEPSEVPTVDGATIVCLHGYYALGDKEPVWYVWDSESTELDDNGSVIQSDNYLTGRWIMIQPTEHCDSRHFGVFPQDSPYAAVDHTTGIIQLVNYCNDKGISPYFDGSPDYPYFIYDSIAVSSRQPIHCSDTIWFVDKGTGNRVFGDWVGNPYFMNENTTLKTATCRHSWHFLACNDCVNYIIDNDTRPATLSNVNVVCEVSPAAHTSLTNCTVQSLGKIDDYITMDGMEIDSSWFATGYDWSKLSLVGCDIKLENIGDADTYIRLKNKQGEADYGDLGEQEVHNATFLDNAIVENFTGTATFQGSAELHNAAITATFTGTTPDLNCIDTWMTVTSVSTPFATFAMRRGSVGGAAFNVLGDTLFHDAVISSAINVYNGSLEMRDSTLSANMGHTASPVKETVIGCIFNAQLNIAGSDPSTKVNATWTNNVGNVSNPILLDRTNLDAVDANHTYVYKNNSGTMEMTATVNMLIIVMGTYQPGTPNELVCETRDGSSLNLFGVTHYVDDGHGNYVEDPNKYVCKIKLFSVGTAGLRKNIRVVPQGQVVTDAGHNYIHIGSSDVFANTLDGDPAGYGNFVSTLLFDAGYDWKLRQLALPCPGASLSPGSYTKIFRIEQIQ